MAIIDLNFVTFKILINLGNLKYCNLIKRRGLYLTLKNFRLLLIALH